MANPEHEAILRQGVEVWNEWFKKNPYINADFSQIDLKNLNLVKGNFKYANFSGSNLSGVNFSNAYLVLANLKNSNLNSANLTNANLNNINLSGAFLSTAEISNANLFRAYLDGADFSEANLYGADLDRASLKSTNLSGANLTKANLSNANLTSANLSNANLTNADLDSSTLMLANLSKANLNEANLFATNLIGANFDHANISGCRVFGISAWALKTENLKQSNLIITQKGEPEITVDNLEIAQFVYLLLNNAKLRSVIDTLTTKSVLILGRFIDERKAVLDAIREELRGRGYVPILFDFDKPISRDLTETVMTLASLARFVIADLSDPNSIPHELMSFVDKLFSVPVQGIFCPTLTHPNPYEMYEHLRRLPHVLPIYRYETSEALMLSLEEMVIKPAEEKVKEVRLRDTNL